MLGMRVRGKKPVAVLVLLLIGLACGEYAADDISQQINCSLLFIGSTLWVAVMVWFVDSQKSIEHENLPGTEVKVQCTDWSENSDKSKAKS
ncbi:hypothetical protein [Pantoea sp.]|uniref:hypothetical protein n=1 Tax=Pantoea sp. TaxID=69393 RepID=UPI00289B2A96|nr:hypothetical protein [Pantoea sp.]